LENNIVVKIPNHLKTHSSHAGMNWRVAILAFILVVVFSVNAALSSATAHAPGLATALTDAQVLELPDLALAPIATLPAGSTVILTGEVAPGFVYVTFDGGSGWVNADLLSVSGRPGIDTTVATSRTLILDAPFPDANELAALEPGDAIVLTGASVGDYAAASRDGIGGWVNRADLGPMPLE
jgi:hypothetical protein